MTVCYDLYSLQSSLPLTLGEASNSKEDSGLSMGTGDFGLPEIVSLRLEKAA